MTTCTLWTGSKFETHGNTYGLVYESGKTILAHRWFFERAYGPVQPGMVLDHLCRNTLCYNLEHLEVVTNRENIMRGEGACAKNARKTHCPKDHPLSGNNLINRSNGKRECRECNRLRQRREP